MLIEEEACVLKFAEVAVDLAAAHSHFAGHLIDVAGAVVSEQGEELELAVEYAERHGRKVCGVQRYE